MTTVGNSIWVATSSMDPLIYLPHLHLQSAAITITRKSHSCTLAANVNGMLLLFANDALFLLLLLDAPHCCWLDCGCCFLLLQSAMVDCYCFLLDFAIAVTALYCHCSCCCHHPVAACCDAHDVFNASTVAASCCHIHFCCWPVDCCFFFYILHYGCCHLFCCCSCRHLAHAAATALAVNAFAALQCSIDNATAVAAF